MTDLAEFVRAAYDAWNSHSEQRWVAHAAADIEVAHSGGFSGRGHDAYRRFFQAWQTAFPDSVVRARRIVADGERAMTESTFSGTHTGTFRTPTGQEIPPTGKTVAVDYTDAWQVVDEKAVYDRVYFDELELLAQLGLYP